MTALPHGKLALSLCGQKVRFKKDGLGNKLTAKGVAAMSMDLVFHDNLLCLTTKAILFWMSLDMSQDKKQSVTPAPHGHWS
jgi:hypothetical protein